MAVPLRLREKVGKSEIKLSLGTAKRAEAKVIHAAKQLEWRQRFRDLEIDVEADALARIPALVEQTLMALAKGRRRDHVVLALSKHLSFRVVTSWGQQFFEMSDARLAFGGKPDVWDAETPSIDIIPSDDRLGVIGRIAAYEQAHETLGMGHRQIVRSILERRRWDLLEIEVMQVEEYTGTCIAFGGALYDAVAEALLQTLVAHRYSGWTEGSLAGFPLGTSPSVGQTPSDVSAASSNGGITAVHPTLPAVRAPLPLTKGLALWRRMQNPSHQSYLEVARAVSRFVALFGDLAVNEISADHIFEYRDLITRMPANQTLSKIHATGQTLRDFICTASTLDAGTPRLLSKGSIKKDLGGLQSVLATAKSERWTVDNVAVGIRTPGYSKKRRGQQNPRRPFTIQMMQTLFASPLFTGCIGPKAVQQTKTGCHVYQDASYWCFLLGAFSGARIEEIGQVRLVDIETIDFRTVYGKPHRGTRTIIYITSGGLNQSVKTDGSERQVIVHPKLIELGFIDFVERRRLAGADRLFDLSLSSGKWTKVLSQRLNRYIDATVTDDKHYTFHSTRHEFKDRAEDSDIPEKISDQMTGHAGTTAGRAYGHGASIRKISKELDKLNTAFVDWHRLMTAAGR